MVCGPPSSREFWRGQRKALWQLLSGVSSEASVGTALAQALHQPLAHHVQQYVVLLLGLGDSTADVSSRDVGGLGAAHWAPAPGTHLTQEPRFEKDPAGLWG